MSDNISKLPAKSKNDGLQECPYCRGTGRIQATFAARLKQLRNQYDLDQLTFAGKVGIGRAQIANLEGGRSSPSIELLMRICNEFEISMDWLTGRANNP